jgi:hypothetical protein
MLDILKQKMLDWTPEKASAFFNSAIDPTEENFATNMWELSNTGYYLYSSRYAGYFDYNGCSYQLFTGDCTSLYELKKQLSESAERNNTTPIEKPTLIELIDMHGYTLTYVEQERPFKCLGIGLMNLISVPQTEFKSALLDFINQFLVDSEELIQLLDVITQTQDRYPLAFDDYFRYDPNSNKFFWAGNFDFEHSRGNMIANMQHSLNMLDIVLANNNYQMSFKEEVNTIIKSKCTILQPL